MRLVPHIASRQVGRAVLQLRKASPNLLFAGGVVGMVTTTVLASKATLKLEPVLDEIESQKALVRRTEPGTELPSGEKYTEDDKRKDMVVLNTRAVVKVVKLYAPTFIVGAATIGCFTGAHVVLTRRNVALTAAYAGLQQAYDGYRARVREQYGEQTELELHHGTKQTEVMDHDINGPKKNTITTIDGTRSMYARFFDETNQNWNPQPEYNLVFIKCQQDWANNMLKARGHVFLNEVYDHLGIDRSGAGAVVGWVLNDGKGGDNYIDFGLYDDRPGVRDFVNGREASILLDFNVDGVIYDKI